MERDIVQKNEGKLTILQMVGFVILLLGVISFIVCAFNNSDRIPSIISVSFFITMLGFSLAFPSLLEGSEGLSTMRVVVFMITNVICMLLLKIGWAEGIKSLENIGLDQYWVGVIAFVFGAKAAQSFFESKLAVPGKTASPDKEQPVPVEFSNDELVKMAIKQFSIKHLPGVVGVGKGFRDSQAGKESCLQINVNDEKFISEYSKPLDVDIGNGKTKSITPKVIFVGKATTHSGNAGSGIINVGGRNGNGTLGCVVIDNDTKRKHLLSCQHVFNHDFNYNDVSSPNTIAFISDTTAIIARHVIGFRTNEIDAALAEIINDSVTDNSSLGKIKGIRNLGVDEIDETLKVKLTGFDEDQHTVVTQEGVVIGNEFFAEFEYPDGKKFGLDDLIVLSKKTGDSFQAISKPGYSGAMVLDGKGFAIGLLVGGDDFFSYAIPIKKIFTSLNCSIL